MTAAANPKYMQSETGKTNKGYVIGVNLLTWISGAATHNDASTPSDVDLRDLK